MKSIRIIPMLLILGMLCSCQMVSPVILQSPQEAESKTAAVLPFKIGVDDVVKKGDADISNASFTILGFYTFKARMPRKDERNYVTQSIADHMNDNSIFNISYVAPYNPKNVDLKVQFEFDEYDIKNNKLYANIINLPLINILAILGAPQEHFTSNIKVKINLVKTNGKIIKSYEYAATDNEWVSLYKQPYANYMWYGSIFQKEFDKMMQFFYGKMQNDKAEILKAVKG